MRKVLLVISIVFCALGHASRAQSPHNSPHSLSGYTPQRVYDSREKRFGDFESMLASIVRADVIFVGEQHDDPNTHRLERALLEGIARRRSDVVVSLEMFERDVQKGLDDYLAGRVTEEEFLKGARPWPRYTTDYRPLVEFARAHKWQVIAGNVPRRHASLVSKSGVESLSTLSSAERGFVATDIQCPTKDDYYKRFVEAMSSHPGQPQGSNGGQPKQTEAEMRAATERMYISQCVKDETMAESIAAIYGAELQPRPLTVHFNGSFHSDFALGTASRVKRRLPKAVVKIVSIVPVGNLDSVQPDEHRKRGDFVVFTLKKP